MASTPFRRLCHWGPITVLGIIKLITWSMVHLHSMWWPPHESLGASLHAALFLSLAAATLYYFLQSLLEGPGFVPLGWKPEKEEDKQYLQFCTVCNGYKAPRSHHCSQCGYCVKKMDHHCPWINCCVKKMDHHCPWINCCVGHSNHGYFNLFLVCAVLGCAQATVVLTTCVYHAINRSRYLVSGSRAPQVYLTLYTLPLALLAIGMALGVVLAVGALLYFQIRGMIRNQTTIEEWIIEKATARRLERGLPPFVFPYDVGAGRNVRLALWGEGDGMHWPVRPDCGVYDLTREQIAQKEEKRGRARAFVAAAAYSGACCPARAWPSAALRAPCAPARLPLRPGDALAVTRQRRHWLFGEKQRGAGDAGRGPRGWFPRAAVVPLDVCKPKPD